MGHERAPARAAGDAARSADTQRGRAAGGSRTEHAAALHGAVGNGALGRALAERSADHAAERVAPGARPADAADGLAAPAPSSARIALGAGEPLAPSTRAALEPSLGPLGDVRVHRDAAAARAASALDALAFTVGHDIAFAEGQYAPQTPGGRWLLAHEAAHAAQQRTEKPSVQRQPRLRLQPDEPIAMCRADEMETDFDFIGGQSRMTPPQAVDQSIPVDAPTTLDPKDPRTRRRREQQQESVVLHSQKLFSWSYIAYAVPVSRVSATPPAHPVRQGTPVPPAPPVPERPAGEAAAANPAFPPDSIVYTPDGRALRVASAGPDFVVTFEVTNYAVGAGSATLVKTVDGFFLLDAGANKIVADAVTNAVVDRIVTQLGGEPIRGVYLTHPHFDHYSLLQRLRARVMIETLAINPATRGTTQYDTLVERFLAGQEEYLEWERQRIRNDPDARDKFVTELQDSPKPEGTLSPERIQQAWEAHVETRVRALPRTQETIAAPVAPGVLDAIGSRPLERGGTGPLEPSTLDVGGTRIRAISDPSLTAATRPRGSAVDTFSSSYFVAVDGNVRMIVLSDLRAADMANIEGVFNTVMAELNLSGRASYHIWQLGHHFGVGFAGDMPRSGASAAQTAAVNTIRASNFRATLQFLHNARSRTQAGEAGVDIVTVSINPAKVDVAFVELLRSVGYHVVPANMPSDVQLVGIRTATGETVTAVIGAPGEMASTPPTLQRAHLARDAWSADIELTREHLNELAPDSPRRPILQQSLDQLTRQRDELAALEKRYSEAVVTTRQGQSITAPAAEAPAARTARVAIEQYCDQHQVPTIEVKSPNLTDAALMLIRRSPGTAPAAGTPEAERRARADAAGELRTSIAERHAQLRQQAKPAATEVAKLYSDLVEYQARLDTIIAETPAGPSRVMLLAEKTRVEQMHREMVVETTERPTASRLPTGELVETKVERVEAPGAGEPSRLARGMVGGLEVIGRGMGAVMVVSSIRGEADLIDRYEKGSATAGQLAAGTAERVTSGVVGLKMLRGAKVGGAVFAAISLLQVAEAGLGHYEDSRDRNIAMLDAAIRGAVGLACMMIGEALIATMNPIGILAGAVIMFLGPQILDVLGLSEWLERKFGFYPENVTGLHQDLRRLLNEYQIISGGIALAMRDATGMSELRTTNAQQLRQRARALVLEHRERANRMEPQILDAFDTAYRTARLSYAGLPELDAWRRDFLQMQMEAWTGLPDAVPADAGGHEYPNQPAPPQDAGVPAGAGQPAGDYEAGTPDSALVPLDAGMRPSIGDSGTQLFLGTQPLVWQKDEVAGFFAEQRRREEAALTPAQRRRAFALARFGETEARISMSHLLLDDIRGMKQWSEIRDGCDNVLGALPTASRDGNWLEVRSKTRELRLMLDNARYRLEPERYGDYRTTPLMAPGTEARTEYERLLADAENRVQRTLREVAYAPHAAAIGYEARRGGAEGGPGSDVTDPILIAEWEANAPQGQAISIPADPKQEESWGRGDASSDVSMAREAVETYEQAFAQTPATPQRFLANNALFRDFAVLQDQYASYVKDDHVERSLARLEAFEMSADMAIETAERIARADVAAGRNVEPVGGVDAVSGGATPPTRAQSLVDEVLALRRRFDNKRADRHWRLGLIFPSEIAGLAAERRGLAVRSYAAALGAGGQPITPAEETALKTGELGEQGDVVLNVLGPIQNRLMLIPDLRIPDAGGVIQGIMRLKPRFARPNAGIMLVGILSFEHHWAEVIPLNAAAEDYYHSTAKQLAYDGELAPATTADLPQAFHIAQTP